MKTKPSFKIFKFSTLVPLGIIIAAALSTRSVYADAIVNDIVFTENSSTSLTATYNGSTSGVMVDSLGHTLLGDTWKVTFPSAVSFNGIDIGVKAFWAEPEPENSSQRPPPVDDPTVPNGTTVTDIGTDTSNGRSISVTFNDNGDVPDTGATLGLLFVSVIALFGLNRLRPVQLA